MVSAIGGIGLATYLKKNLEKNKNRLIDLDKPTILSYIYCIYINKMNTNKRKYRELNPETKQKISQSMRGKSKTLSHKEAISNGLKSYWQNIPHKPTDEGMGSL